MTILVCEGRVASKLIGQGWHLLLTETAHQMNRSTAGKFSVIDRREFALDYSQTPGGKCCLCDRVSLPETYTII
jgi:hypothetical protein